MSPKRFFYILVGIFVVLVVAGGYGYFQASNFLHAQTQDYSKKLADKQLSEDRISQIDDLKSQFRKLESDITLIETALPKTAQQAELTLQLQNIANQSGMSISEINFPTIQTGTTAGQTKAKAVAKAETVDSYTATFNLTGNYSQLQAFLQRQENLSRYTNVINLAISADKDKVLAFAITINAYIKP